VSRLPGAAACRVDDAKIRDYLLNPDNRQNSGKAWLFERFGFRRADCPLLTAALQAHVLANDVLRTSASVHGTKYVVRCNLPTPDQRNPCLTSVWIIEAGQTTPKLVTAY
jgi:hypothetical protein